MRVAVHVRGVVAGALVLVGLAVACRVPPPPGPPLAAAVRLAGFDPAALAEGRPPELGPLPPLRVRDYGPEGVSHGERIRVRLNQPLFDLPGPVAAVGKASPVELELWALPAVESEAPRRVPATSRVVATDALELVPDAPLADATAYEVVLPAGLESRDGSTLEALRWRFETPRPGLAMLEPDQMHEAHVNLIQHGRRTCHARKPACDACAVAPRCRFIDRRAP